MQKFLKIIVVLFLSLLILGCENSLNETDIIEPIKLVSGISDSVKISDLFYSPERNYEVINNEYLDVKLKEEILYLKSDADFEGITFLEIKSNADKLIIPIVSKKANIYSFYYKPEKKYTRLTLFGSFNGWNRAALPMTDEDRNGIYEAKVILDPGVYQYKFYGDGEEIVDPLNPIKVSNGMGSFNSVRTIEDNDTSKFYLHIDKYYSKNPQSTFSFYVEDGLDGELKTNNVFALLNNEKISADKFSIAGKYISISFNYNELQSQTMRVAVSKNGRVSNIQTIKLQNGKPLGNESFTWNDGIIYSLMIDRFYDGNNDNNSPVKHDSLSPKANYSGGDLEGVSKKLSEGYFEELGVNVIWISPVLDNPNEAFKEYPAPHRYYSGYHGYWPISSKSIDEHFGNMENLKEFINKAHEKGIKVLLDFVSNHVHIEHPYFKEHRDWFGKLELPDGRLNLRFWDEYRLTTWFEPYLASFDYLGSEEALEEMTDVAVWWLNETGADGYRHDAVKHVPNEFWRRLNEKIRKEVSSQRDLPVYQIGETFGSYELISSYVNNGQLNSQFNFNLYDVAIPTFTSEDASFSTLNKEMQKTFSVYGTNHLMGNVMDSHDKNRFMAYADNDLLPSEWSAIEHGWNNPPVVDNPENYKKLILYMAYMNTIPGLPVIYYGSEFGMSGASDPDNRRMMRFDDDLSKGEKSTLSEVSKIIKLRREHTALRHGDFYPLIADKDIYAYVRSDMNEKVLVVLNKGSKKDVELSLPAELNLTNMLDLNFGKSEKIVDSSIKFSVDKMSWGMYLLN